MMTKPTSRERIAALEARVAELEGLLEDCECDTPISPEMEKFFKPVTKDMLRRMLDVDYREWLDG